MLKDETTKALDALADVPCTEFEELHEDGHFLGFRLKETQVVARSRFSFSHNPAASGRCQDCGYNIGADVQ